MRAYAVILTLVFLSCYSLAEEIVPVPLHTEGTGGWSYELARRWVLDIDKTLKNQGINAQVCTYRNLNPLQDFSFKGIGPCLFEDFKKSMKTNDLSGIVYTWIQDKKGKYHAIEIRWRPPRGGWAKTLEQTLEMKFEKPLYKTRRLLGGADFANKLRYNDFLAGELNIILPQDPDAIAALMASGNQWLVTYAQGIKEVDFKLKPTEIQDGKLVYQGQLSLGMHTDKGETQTKFDIKTNINVVVLNRSFFIKGHLEAGDRINPPSLTGVLP